MDRPFASPRPNALTAASAAALAILALLLRFEPQSRRIEDIQLFCVPLLFLFLFKMKLTGVCAPKTVLAAGLLASLCALNVSHHFLWFGQPPALVSRLAGDELEIASRDFRKKIAKVGAPLFISTRAKISRERQAFKSQQEITDFLSRQQAPAIVWGSQRWLNISFGTSPMWVDGEVSIFKFPGVPLQMTDSVSALGMSYRPEDASALFIGRLFAVIAFAQYYGVPRIVRDEALFTALQNELLTLGETLPFWTVNGHRAYPHWVLGRLYTYRAFASGDFQRAELYCALKSFAAARRLLLPGQNNELLAAILNDEAVARYKFAEIKNVPRWKAAALFQLRSAARFRIGEINRPALVAAANLMTLKHFAARKKKPVLNKRGRTK